MNVTLTTEQEAFVNSLVESGEYLSTRHVLSEALHLLKQQETLRQKQLEELRTEVQKGIASLEQGRYREYSDTATLFDHIKAEGRKRAIERGELV